MKRLASIAAIALTALFASVPAAAAHAGHDDRIKIIFAEGYAEVQLSVDAKAFFDFDIDRDGELSRNEYEIANNDIRAFIEDNVRLIDYNGQIIFPVFKDLPIEGFAGLSKHNPIHRIKIVRRYSLEGAKRATMLVISLLAREGSSRAYVIFREGNIERGVVEPGDPKIRLF